MRYKVTYTSAEGDSDAVKYVDVTFKATPWTDGVDSATLVYDGKELTGNEIPVGRYALSSFEFSGVTKYGNDANLKVYSVTRSDGGETYTSGSFQLTEESAAYGWNFVYQYTDDEGDIAYTSPVVFTVDTTN